MQFEIPPQVAAKNMLLSAPRDSMLDMRCSSSFFRSLDVIYIYVIFVDYRSDVRRLSY